MDLIQQVQHLHDDQVIGTLELATMLNTTEAQVYKLNSVAPERLPPRLKIFGRKLAWRVGTCRAWIRSLIDCSAGPTINGTCCKPTKPKRSNAIGRPRKSTFSSTDNGGSVR